VHDPLDISSDPPLHPLAISFDAAEPLTLPGRPRKGHRAGPGRRLVAFAVDGALLASLFAALSALALWNNPYAVDQLRAQARLFAALFLLLAVAYSWFFVALAGKTPGMAAAGLRLRTLDGRDPTPQEALARALLALFSLPGLFGFLLALFDARGQTLHDKLCRCVALTPPPPSR
jgi:uncharacterized RDD family membrane protein YckC